MANIELGSGLIRIGREWGAVQQSIPTETESMRFLESAYNMGIRFFDTAPAYGLSEARLGRFLQSLGNTDRKKVRVSTKFGEYWDSDKGTSYVDHTAQTLKTSLDRSMDLLGPIDLIQLHKSTPLNILANDTLEAFSYAKQKGVSEAGISVSDSGTAEIALASGLYTHIQVPFNAMNRDFEYVIRQAHERGMKVLVNRPFQMGQIVENGSNLHVEAFSQILSLDFEGYVLTGTASIKHLEENIASFEAAKAKIS